MANKKRAKNNKKKIPQFVLPIVLTACLAFLILIAWLVDWAKVPELILGTQHPTSDPQQSTAPQFTWDPDDQTQEAIPMGHDLVIDELGNYTGIYMEDGTDEVVSNVMTILVKNNSANDLQLARIQILYPDFTAQFEVTNLPAGETIVLLEKTRASLPEEDYLSIETKNVVFFQEPMNILSHKIEITGGSGYIDIKNISGEAITGVMRLFYKNSAQDLLYGGITYVATVNDGIAAGETIRILAGHYTEGNSRIVHVTLSE